MLCNAPQSAPVKEQDAFRFFVTTNPDQLKDKAEMRENRKHVMRDYLRKERCKAPGTRDVRAEGHSQIEKRRRLLSNTKKPGKSLNLAAPSHLFGPGALTPQSSCDGTAKSESGSTMTLASRGSDVRKLTLIPQSMAEEDDEYPTCACARSDPEHLSGTCECNWPEQDREGFGIPDLFFRSGLSSKPIPHLAADDEDSSRPGEAEVCVRKAAALMQNGQDLAALPDQGAPFFSKHPLHLYGTRRSNAEVGFWFRYLTRSKESGGV